MKTTPARIPNIGIGHASPLRYWDRTCFTVDRYNLQST